MKLTRPVIYVLFPERCLHKQLHNKINDREFWRAELFWNRLDRGSEIVLIRFLFSSSLLSLALSLSLSLTLSTYSVIFHYIPKLLSLIFHYIPKHSENITIYCKKLPVTSTFREETHPLSAGALSGTNLVQTTHPPACVPPTYC